MRRFVFFLLLIVMLAPPVAAQTPEERQRLDWMMARGLLLFEIDRTAWVTTDDLREHLSAADQRLIRGWTVERDGNAFVVTYFMLGEEDLHLALYRARVENRRVVSRETFRSGSRPELTPLQRRLADARGVVAGLGQRPCSNAPFNTAIIPPATPDGPLDVYALTAQTDSNIFPFGGHFRATVSPAGEILSQRSFMRSCFNAPRPPRRGGARPVGLFITHLLDPVPTEIHVFMSTWMGFPVFVGTGERVWSVDRNAIRLIDTPQSRKR